MKCELCNSGRCGHKSRLCEPCTEAIVRLWTIANNTCPPTNGAGRGRCREKQVATCGGVRQAANCCSPMSSRERIYWLRVPEANRLAALSQV